MKLSKAFLVGGLTVGIVTAMACGFAACGDNNDPGDNGDPVTVAGGYEYLPPDQGGYGLKLNLYEDGKYYFSQFTQSQTRGTYTSTEATGTDSEGRTILYNVTFNEDIFAVEGKTHQLVKDANGVVYLTSMYDSMSMTAYDLKKSENLHDEDIVTVCEYWAENYKAETGDGAGVKIVLSSDGSKVFNYNLSGINGIGQVGSVGTYTSATDANGIITYTLTDGADATKVYTLVVGLEVKLTVGTKEYTMTDFDPDAVLTYTFEITGVAYYATIRMSCYDNGNFRVEFDGGNDVGVFPIVTGTYGEPTAANNEFTFIFADGRNGASATFENGSYVLKDFELGDYAEYVDVEKVDLTYTPEATLSYAFTGSYDEWGATLELLCMSDGTCSLSIDLQQKWVDAKGMWKLEGDVFTVELTPMGENGELLDAEYKATYTTTKTGNSYAFGYVTYSITGTELTVTMTYTAQA